LLQHRPQHARRIDPLRLLFPQRVNSPGVLRAVLKQLAEQARAA